MLTFKEEHIIAKLNTTIGFRKGGVDHIGGRTKGTAGSDERAVHVSNSGVRSGRHV